MAKYTSPPFGFFKRLQIKYVLFLQDRRGRCKCIDPKLTFSVNQYDNKLTFFSTCQSCGYTKVVDTTVEEFFASSKATRILYIG